MFVPEYTITSGILKNIATAEYSKAIVENSTILLTWERQLQKDCLIKNLLSHSENIGIRVSPDNLKKHLDGFNEDLPLEIENLENTYKVTSDLSQKKEFGEFEIKYLHKNITTDLIPREMQGVYRGRVISEKPEPEEILAKMVEVFDWFNGADAKETHPIIVSAIIRGVYELIQPFEKYNDLTGDLSAEVTLKMNDYNFRNWISISNYYSNNQADFELSISSITDNEPDFTEWIEFFSRAVAHESNEIKEKVKLLEKESKIAKVSGRTELTDRQEKIIEYLQDYGILQNKDFPRLFPNKSEDSILRDLKLLLDKKMIIKSGSTKSSRYELR